MKITYCDGWFRAKKCYTQLWDESRARQAYDKRELHVVLIGDPKHPECFVELMGDYVGVHYLDKYLREYRHHVFVEKEPGKLFMQEYLERQYDGKTDTVVSGDIIRYKPDGLTYLEEFDEIKHEKVSWKTWCKVDGCWEPYPQFGDYASLIRKERKDIEPLEYKR
jgi:hypothetical protein